MDALFQAAEADSRVTLVVGDLGYSVVDQFAARFPNQFLNVGVAEQNMAGVAAGLALSGQIVFTYSIANFPTFRCLEQVRNDICYHGADVKITAVGGGFAYGALGVSHHATEDLAIMRSLPGMTVIAPGDPTEAARAVPAVIARSGPCYVRLGKAGEPQVHTGPIDFRIGRAIRVREGGDLTLITTGGLLANTMAAAEELSRQHRLEATVFSMHTLKPLDTDAVVTAARQTAMVVTIEEHSVIGGLGGAVAEVLAEQDAPRARLTRIGIPSAFDSRVGTQAYLRERHGLSVDALVGQIAGAVTAPAI